MARIPVRSLGDGTPSSLRIPRLGFGDATPINPKDTGSTSTGTAFDFTALPGQILTGAEQWMTPSEAISTVTGAFSGGASPVWGVVAGVVLVPLIGLAVLGKVMHKGRR